MIVEKILLLLIKIYLCKKKLVRIIFIFLFTLFSYLIYSQHTTIKSRPVNPQDALNDFYAQNYTKALNQLLILLKSDSTNIQYNQFAGVCLLNTFQAQKAIPYFEYVIRQKKFDFYTYYDLGIAYMHCHRFEDAINSFNHFIDVKRGKEVNQISADREIEMCKSAIELIKNPVKVKFENAGETINSSYPDLNPLINADESLLIFTSRRQGNTGNMTDNDGYLTPDIYYSEKKGKSWEKAKKITGGINTAYTEQSVGLSPNGDVLFLCIDDVNHKFKVLSSNKKGKNFTRPEAFSENIYENSNTTGACTSKDNKVLFFSSDKPGGKGGKDIYFSRKLPSGEWSSPKNAGAEVNTEFDEDYPMISHDDSTLFFASTGHNSMGGFDVFKCSWNKDDDSFSETENLGFPVNDTYDNKIITLTRSGRYAYISTNRPDAFGHLDIYRVIFEDVKFKDCIYKGTILGKDTENVFSVLRGRIAELQTKADDCGRIYDSLTAVFKPTKKNPVNTDSTYIQLENLIQECRKEITTIKDSFYVYVTITDKRNTSLVKYYRPNQYTGRFIVPFQPGEYILQVTAKDFAPFKKEILIRDEESQPRLIEEDIPLHKNSK